MSATAGAARGLQSRTRVHAHLREHGWVIALWTAIVVWSTTLFLVMRDLFLDFRLARYDLGNMTQAVWSTADGRPLDVTDGVTGDQMSRLGQHVDPILAVLAPFWIVAPSPLTLVAVQIVAVSLGALPVLWLARRHLGSEHDAVLLALAYLAYPWIAWVAIDGFHPLTLAIPLLLLGIWFLDGDRLLPFALCAGAAALTGELVGVWIAGLGLWYAVARGHRRVGLLTSVAGLAWTVFAVRVVVPALSGESSDYYGVYDRVGGSPSGVVKTAFTDPLTIVSAATTGGDIFYLVMLFAPLAGMFLLAPALAAVAIPQLAATLLAGFGAATDPRAHYIAGSVPFLVAATAMGLGRRSPAGRRRGVVLVLTLSVAFSLALGPWPLSPGRSVTSYWSEVPGERVEALRSAVALVPEDASLSTTNRLGSHLAERRYFYSVPVVGRAEWIVLDAKDAWIPSTIGGDSDPDELEEFHARIASSARWNEVFAREDVFVYRRVEP